MQGQQQHQNQEPLETQFIKNDHTEESLLKLNALKNIIASQLLIPRNQITKNIFDDEYESIILKEVKNDKILGGSTFKTSNSLKICNIEYFAVAKSQVRKGLGKKVIDALKIQMLKRGMNHLVTQADQFSIQFYQRSGFVKISEKDLQNWESFLGDYSNTTILQYKIHEGIDPVHCDKIVVQQLERMKNHLQNLQYRQFHYRASEIDQLLKEKFQQIEGKKKQISLQLLELETQKLTLRDTLQIKILIKLLQKHRQSWICEKPMLGRKINEKLEILSLSQIENYVLENPGIQTALKACSQILKTLEVIGKQLSPQNSSYQAYLEFKLYCQPLVQKFLNGSFETKISLQELQRN